MSESFIGLPTDGPGKLLRTEQLTVGANTTQQEVVSIGDPSTPTSLAAVKAASTPAAATDPALVVAISPNNTIPVKTGNALTASSPTAATVAATSGSAIGANSNRRGLVLINTSPNYISLGFGAAAVLDSGITLNPNGGTYVMDEFTFTTSAVNAIASSAGSNLAIQEFTN